MILARSRHCPCLCVETHLESKGRVTCVVPGRRGKALPRRPLPTGPTPERSFIASKTWLKISNLIQLNWDPPTASWWHCTRTRSFNVYCLKHTSMSVWSPSKGFYELQVLHSWTFNFPRCRSQSSIKDLRCQKGQTCKGLNAPWDLHRCFKADWKNRIAIRTVLTVL